MKVDVNVVRSEDHITLIATVPSGKTGTETFERTITDAHNQIDLANALHSLAAELRQHHLTNA